MTVAPSGLVGRDRELSLVARAIAAGESPIVTLWGSGGIGKTSLARAVSRALDAAAVPGGRVFCALADVRSLGDLAAIVADALAVPPRPARTDAEALARVGRALAGRGRTLVVLDNVEQLVPAAAHALAIWTAAAPEACFLVTSRELLGVDGERPIELLPLGADAVRLLVERARVARPSFAASEATLARIAERLDGIPLAIELAAARLAVVSAEELLAGLDDRFSVLRRDHGGAALRQRALYDAIDWSWGLLDDRERLALAQLSVFRGGFDAATAAKVLRGVEDVAGAVGALRHKSLVVEQAASARTDASAPRFALLESIRDFAAARLGDEARASSARHAAVFVELARGWAQAHEERGDPQALARLALETENLLAVAEREPGAPALEALVALEPVLSARGEAAKLARLLRDAIATDAARAAPAATRLRALEVKAACELALGDLVDAAEALEAAGALAASEHDHARVLGGLAAVTQARGDLEEARRLAERALAHAERAGPVARREAARSISTLALVLHVTNRFDEAGRRYEEGLAIQRELGDVRGEIRTLARLGFLMHDLGDDTRAMERYGAAIALQERHGIVALKAIVAGYQGNVLRAQGRRTEALARYEEALAALRIAGDKRFEATFLMDRGIAHVLADARREAIADLDAAAALAEEVGDEKLVALVFGYAIVARCAVDDVDGARAALDRARTAVGEGTHARELLETFGAHVDVAIARRGAVVDEAALDRARARLAALGERPLGQHRRVGAQLLRRAIERAAPPADAVVFERSAGKLRLPASGGAAPTVVALEGRAAVSGVVRALVERRLASPGSVVTLEELVRAGWPGEKLVASAAKNRVRVLVAGLRAEGLRDVLKSAAGGYLLDPAIRAIALD